MFRLLAHAGEVHSTASEAASHRIDSWYIALPLFLLAMVGIAAIVQLTFRKSFVTTAVMAAILLVIGFSTYNFSPLISVISITVGLIASMVITLASLTTPKAAAVKIKGDKK